MVEVRQVDARDTLPLRQVLLRPHQTIEELAAEQKSYPDSRTFAALDDTGRVVGTGVVTPRSPSWAPDQPGWQVRAMAVVPDHQGQGIGTAILQALLAHVVDHGGGLIWCHARVPARNLYERAGFQPVGDPFDVPSIGPHITMAHHDGNDSSP
jgi:GNAT superfamily N-acetyltransferase